MKIVRDEPKRRLNLAKHGLDFADLQDGSFFATALITPARASRFKAIGVLADGTIAVIFAMLGREALSVITMRPASKTERMVLR